MYELGQSNSFKVEQLQLRLESDKKRALQKSKEEVQLKNDKLKEMERQIQKDKALREKAESSIRQCDELKDMQRSLKTDRDVVKQEKVILEEKVNRQNEELINLKDQLNAKMGARN